MKKDWILTDISDHPTLPMKRKVNCWCFKPNGDEQVIEMFLIVQHYEKLQDGNYGEKISAKGVQDYEAKLVASNLIQVDPVDGMECYYVELTPESTDEEGNVTPATGEWRRFDNNKVVTSIGQFDFFDDIIKNKVVQIKYIIQKYVELNDLIKKRWD